MSTEDTIIRIFDKLEETNKAIADLRVEVAELKIAVKNWKAPERPCPGHVQLVAEVKALQLEFDNHISEHKTMDIENKTGWDKWKDKGRDLLFELIRWAVIGSLMYIVSKVFS